MESLTFTEALIALLALSVVLSALGCIGFFLAIWLFDVTQTDNDDEVHS